MSLILAALSYRQLDLERSSTAPTPLSSRETRTTASIIWSCLSMIILCTWTSVRPNVPSVPRSGHEALVYWDKAKIFCVALLAPELIVLWSIRQWFAARKMAKAYQRGLHTVPSHISGRVMLIWFSEYGWTMTHAFFALMGGFALYDSEGEFLFHLWDRRFCEHFRNAVEGRWDGYSRQQHKLRQLLPYKCDDQYEVSISYYRSTGPTESWLSQSLLEYCVATKWVTITEKEIESFGHTDLLAKTIAIFQTLYFIINCTARGVNGLAITELEILTLGFAALNLVSYSFWWHKPSGVRFPLRIMDRPESISLEQLSVARNTEESGSTLLGTDIPAMPTNARAPGILSAFWDRFRDDYIVNEWDTYDDLGSRVLWILLLPLMVVGQIFNHALNGDSDGGNRPQPERGNIFSATTGIQDRLVYTLTCSTAILLGVIHCIPIMLNYRGFPGDTIDHHLWTGFALSITGLPLGIWIVQICPYDGERYILTGNFVVFLTAMIYPTARIVLIVLTVKQLTDLPSSALQEVEWTSLIPHFGA
ncbi:hypothetical protein PM082_017596 [Marasmius tenuissimus]|nr:hypothetical protein PM082_017596 [Marasmius tenuissimus]